VLFAMTCSSLSPYPRTRGGNEEPGGPRWLETLPETLPERLFLKRDAATWATHRSDPG
jgi:hypothetical protein